MPLDIIKLNSLITIKAVNTNSVMPLQLVIPMFEDLERNKISVLSPLGVTLLGYSQGDKTKVTFSENNKEEYLITEVAQGEKAEKIEVPI